MSIFTEFLNLLKKDPATEGNDTFNIKTMLNDNWDKIDAGVKTISDAQAAHSADNVTDAGGVHGFVIETGAWTPVISAETSALTISYSVQRGRYVKIGKIIKCGFFIRCTVTGGEGNINIEGLPVVVKNLDEFGILGRAVLGTTSLNFGALYNVTTNASKLRIYKNTFNNVAADDINTGVTLDLSGNITYEIA